jgi:hypothetical protein
MIRVLSMCLATFPAATLAQEWQALDGAALEAALNATTLQYDGASQVFYVSGRTLYDNGRPSWGYWAARGDSYCSQWPPADGWECYAVEQHVNGGALRFISETGFVTEGVIVE